MGLQHVDDHRRLTSDGPAPMLLITTRQHAEAIGMEPPSRTVRHARPRTRDERRCSRPTARVDGGSGAVGTAWLVT